MKPKEEPKPVVEVKQELPPMTVPLFFSYYCTEGSEIREELVKKEKEFLKI